MSCTVQSHYKVPQYNMDLDITWPKYFYHGILPRDYRKMTIKRSFSYNSFVKLSLYNMIHLTRSIPMDPKYSVIKGLHCTGSHVPEERKVK